jgi:hypothetical protein
MVGYPHVSGYTSIHTLKLRSALEYLKKINLTFKDISDLDSKIYIPPDCSEFIRKSVEANGIQFGPEETKRVHEFFSKDYHDMDDFAKVVAALNRASIAIREGNANWKFTKDLYIAFGVDGLGNNPVALQEYAFNLQYEMSGGMTQDDSKGCHVAAVRHLHSQNEELDALKLRELLYDVVNFDNTKNNYATQYMNFIGTKYDKVEELLKNRIKSYESHQNLEKIEVRTE